MPRCIPALVAVFLCLAINAQAQSSECAPADEILEALALQHGETPSHRGMLNNNNLFLVVSSPTGTFTLLVVPQAEGELACVVAAGYGFEPMPVPPPSRGTAM